MPAFKVRAMAPGEYNGNLYGPGQEFFLIDRKDPDTGEVIQKAEEAFAEWKNRKHGTLGWMQRVGAAVSSETPEQRAAREAEAAQRKADAALMAGRGMDLNDPNLMLNAAGTGMVPKIKGGMGFDGAGSAAENEGSKLASLIAAGYTEAQAREMMKPAQVSSPAPDPQEGSRQGWPGQPGGPRSGWSG